MSSRKAVSVAIVSVLAVQGLVLLVGYPALLPTSSAISSTKQTIFWLTNDQAHPNVNGISTYGIMNTSQKFSSNSTTALNTNLLTQDWYLFPTLAGPYTIGGTIFLGIWINATGSNAKGTPSVSIYERSVNGTENIVPGTSSSLGNQKLFNTPHYLNLSVSTSGTYTFERGSSIHFVFSIQCGSSTTCEIWYGSKSYDSRLSLPSQNSMVISSVKTYNANMSQTMIYSDGWSSNQRLVIVLANVTDPFGAYDIQQVNATVAFVATSSEVLSAPMNRTTAGLPTDYSEVYEAVWSYPSTATGGNYSATVYGVDNNGVYYKNYFGNPDFGPYLVVGTGYFSIGVSVPLAVRVVDGHGLQLGSATVAIMNGQVTYASGMTNSSGLWQGRVFNSISYNVVVGWEKTIVANQSVYVSKATTLSVTADVHYPTLITTDSKGNPLGDAEVFLTFPNGTSTTLPLYTVDTGSLSLPRSPGGNWSITIYWQNQRVGSRSIEVNSDGPFRIMGNVFSLPVDVTTSLGGSLANAYVIAYSRNTVEGFGTTSSNGTAVFRLPIGNYTFNVYWGGQPVGSQTASITSNNPIMISAKVFSLSIKVTDNSGAAVDGANAAVYNDNGGAVQGFEITNSNGSANFLLPIGNYTVKITYTGSYWLSEINSNASKIISLTSSETTSLSLANYPPAFTSTNGFFLILTATVIAVGAGAATFLVLKRKK